MPSVFLCHASEDKPVVEPMQLALASAGCEVFYDQESLPAGGDYHARIRDAIQRCDVFVFVASPASITPGKFTLTELKFARERWPSPVKRVLPVAIGGLKPNDLPKYLQAATVLTISGNPAAEVRAAVEGMLIELKSRKPRRLAVTLGIGGVALTLSLTVVRLQGPVSAPPQPEACRHESHGVESYRKDLVVDRVSPWMGGGFSQDPWCAEVTGKLKGEYPTGVFEVVDKSESKKNTCPPFNCPQYQYVCKVRVRAEPIYALQRSPACK